MQVTEDIDDEKRRLRVVEPLDNAMQRVVDGMANLLESRDDAWWAEHDARIAAAKVERQARDASLALDQRSRELMSSRGFPVRAMEAALASWPSSTLAMDRMRAFADDTRRVIVLAGGTGAGKSSAAAWFALHHGASKPEFIRASEFERLGRYDQDARERLAACSMLVLDDLGVEYLDDKNVFRGLLDETIDRLYANRRRLVITTNLRVRQAKPSEPAQFLERYGDRIASRLHEIGRWVDCGHVDLRRQKAANE